MTDKRENTKALSTRIAMSAMVVALGVVLMLLGGVIPIATYCTPLFAGLLLLPIMLEFGFRQAWLCWLATALLSLFVSADKEASFFYIFVGYYPLIKPKLDKIYQRIPRIIAKLALFIVQTGLMYAFLYFVLQLSSLIQEIAESAMWLNIMSFAVMILCLMLYDLLLMPMMLIYVNKIKPKLKILK